MEERYHDCPHCWETISVILDPSADEQVFIEDCEVCCNPIEFHVRFEGGSLMGFETRSLEQ